MRGLIAARDSRLGFVALTLGALGALTVRAPRCAAASEPAPITMRSGETPPNGSLTTISIAGLTVTDASAQSGVTSTVVLAWDRVADVSGPAREQALPYLGLAQAVWRARIRMTRGDLAGAEPLLEHAFTDTQGKLGPTPALVASGLVRCRIARRAHESAVRAWISLLASNEPEALFQPASSRARSDAAGTLAFTNSPMMDPASKLCPQLPPFWLPSPALATLADDLDTLLAQSAAAAIPAGTTTNDPAITQEKPPGPTLKPPAWHDLAGHYATAARIDLGEDTRLPPPPAPSDWGKTLVWNLVAARSRDSVVRSQARASLDTVLADAQNPAWVEAWCRAGKGASLLLEPQVPQRRLGLAELLHLPARFAASQPGLAGYALARAARELANEGDATGAATLRAELVRLFPDHPALVWMPAMSTPETAGNASIHNEATPSNLTPDRR